MDPPVRAPEPGSGTGPGQARRSNREGQGSRGARAAPIAARTHSGSATPEPPISAGRSFILGSPSRIGSTVSW